IHFVVAETLGTLIGCGYARIQDAKPYLRHRTYCYLGFMYTAPQYRGMGVNKKIIEALKTWCLSREISEMRLEVYANNVAAHRAYEKAGFVNHMLEMRMEVK